ncbi:MAG: uroporphyrinogen decarboxylase family protein, partial [Methanomassiliicoccales archaeon]
HLVGMENLLLGIITDPDAADEIVRGAAEVSRAYMEALDGAGADVVLLSNPSASADMISPEMHARFSLPHTRYCLEALECARSVLHICGNSTLHLENMIATGVDALSVEEKVDPYEAVRIVGKRAALVGNVGVVSPLLQGTRERVREHTLRVMDAGFDVVNPGCGLAPRIPLENLREMVRTVKG